MVERWGSLDGTDQRGEGFHLVISSFLSVCCLLSACCQSSEMGIVWKPSRWESESTNDEKNQSC